VCGVEIEYTGKGGRPRKYCPDHRNQKNRARDSRAAAKRGDPAAIERMQSVGYADQVQTSGAELELLAIYLGITGGDIASAAKMAGVQATGAELKAMAKQARSKHKGLVSNSPASVAEIGQQARTLMMISLRQAAPEMSAQQLGAGIKQITESLGTMTGGDGNVYAEVSCTIAAPSAQEVVEWAKKTGADVKILNLDW
jgi:hypothetical protein